MTMFLPPSVKIFISDRPVDMRKGFDGLIAIVRQQWQSDIFSGHLFVFVGSQLDRVKILYWDTGGFVLYYKRLERGRFKIPRLRVNQSAIELDATELSMLLDGIDYERVKRKSHWQPKKCSKVDRQTTRDLINDSDGTITR
jgi:transposase